MTLLWTFPAIMLASIIIGWAAEVTAIYLSAGIALAVLAWLQTAPEFAVEATIAWQQNSHLALANLTGSLRLLMGFGWPMIMFIHWYSTRKRRKNALKLGDVTLPKSFSVEAAGLLVPVVYFLVIYLKKTWSFYDGVILCSFYGFYFWLLNRQRKVGFHVDEIEDDAPEPWVVEKVRKLPGISRPLAVIGFFVVGGGVLLITVHPFVDALKASALALGISEFVFIQWLAPIASEFPEKVTAFNWARRANKVPMAVVNMLSSVTSQWTLLAGLVPVVFSISAGHAVTLELSDFQRTELLLTIAQSLLAVLFLSDLKIRDIEAMGLFTLWFVQFLMPTTREPLVVIYAIWIVFEASRLVLRGGNSFVAWKTVGAILRGRK